MKKILALAFLIMLIGATCVFALGGDRPRYGAKGAGGYLLTDGGAFLCTGMIVR